MTDNITTNNPELDVLFERYRKAPGSHVFAPLADACRKAGLLDEAIEIVEKGIQENPDYTSGFVVRGKCYFDRGDVDRAESSFERVLELDSNNLVALKFLGVILADRGDATAAREHFKHILALDPEDRRIREAMETLPELVEEAEYEELEDPVSREHRVDSAHEEPTELPEIHDDGFEGAAISLGRDSDEKSPDESDELATMTLADIYAAQGYTDKAVRIYREILRAQPANREIHRKIRQLTGEPEPDETGEGAAQETQVETHEIEEPGAAASRRAGGESGFEEVPGSDSEAVPPRRIPHTPAPPALTHQPKGMPETEPGNPIDEGRSYEQFKRWVRNIAD
jgi:tetratricopeptide (TPR) repeat protein